MAVKKQEIEQMTPQERLWSSLEYSYGKQREASDKSFNKAKSEADRRALAKGTQRGSYNAQVQANLDAQKIEAQNQSYEAQNAAYASGLNQLDQQAKEDDRWERQFAETLNQNSWQRSFQETAAQRAADQFNLQFNAGREDAAFNKEMQRQQFAANQEQTLWQRGITEQQLADTQANTAWQQGITERELANSEANTAWQQGITERQLANTESQNAWQQGITERELANSEASTAWQQGITERQLANTESQNAWQRGITERELANSEASTAWQQGITERQLANTESQNAWQQGITERELANSEAQTAWQRGITERELANTESQNAWQQGITERELANSEANTAWQQAFQEGEAQRAADQFERQFGQSTQTTDQQIAMGWVQTALANGQIPSDDLLARAGLSRADAQTMVKKMSSSSGPAKSKTPWELLGITEEQYNKILSAGEQPSQPDLSAYVAALGAASAAGVSTNPRKDSYNPSLEELQRMAR